VKHLLLYGLLALATVARSQDSSSKTYTIADGLSSSIVYSSYQDEKGMMWFGTDRGLSRYDGYEFTTFSLSDGLSDTEIFRIEPDKEGRIWLLTNNGIPTIYHNNRFKNNDSDSLLSKFTGGSFLWCQFQAPDGSFWFGTQNDGIIHLGINGSIVSYTPKNDATCFHIWQAGDGSMMFATLLGIYKLTNGTFEKITGYELYTHRRFNSELGVLLLSEGNRLIQSDNLSLIKMYEVAAYDGIILFVSKADDHSVWVGTSSGLYQYDIYSGASSLIIEDIEATSMTVDHEKGLWVTTLNSGVHYVAADEPELLALCTEYKEDIRFIHVIANDKILVSGTTTCTYDTESGKSVEKNNMPSTVINQVIEKNGEVFYATNMGLYHDIDSVRHHYLENVAVKDIVFIDKNSLGIVLSRVVLKVPLDKIYELKIKNVMMEQIAPYVIYDEAKPTVIELIGDVLWIGAVDGLYAYNLRSAKLSDMKTSYPLLSGSINDLLYVDSSLWIGTSGNGTFELGLREHHLRQHTTTTGLQSDFTSMLAYDSLSNYLINVTSTGLDLWDGTHWLNIPLNLRLNSSKKSLAIVKGDYYLSSGGNFFRFNPINWLKSIQPLKIQKIRLLENDQEVEITEEINLVYTQDNIRVQFTSISYRFRNQIKYNYELFDGIEMLTSGSTKERELQFPSLAPGNYQFTVWTSVGSGLRGEPLTIDFNISPPFWKTWWFQMSVWLIGVGLIYLFFKIRVLTYNRDIVRELITAIIQRVKRDKKIILKDNTGNFVSFSIKELLYIKAAENYVEVNCAGKRHLVRVTMKKVEEQLKEYKNFLRIHHSYIVNMYHTETISGTHLMIGKELIPISRRKRSIIDLPNAKIIIQ